MEKYANRAVLTAFLAFGIAASAFAAEPLSFSTDRVELRADIVAGGLENPWGLAFLPGGGALVTERPGRMRLIGADGTLSEPIGGLPEIAAIGQGGLLDVAVAADFAQSGTIFFTFAEPGRGGAGTAIASARLVRDGAAARLEDVRVLFSMAKKTGRGQHFGSRIVVHPDGTIFFTTGDRGEGPRAQDMGDAAGAVLRINADGSVPSDNPYASGAGGALPQIWSKGHRNPQGLAIDSAGTLWTVEHGAKGGDEVNTPQAGRNYGWPVISYGVDYSGTKIGQGTEAPGYEQPVHYWDPSIAPSGLVVYEGAMFPEWRGDLLAGALKFQLLSRLDRDANGNIVAEERMLDGAFGRIRDVNVAPDGAIWLLTDETDGQVVRLSRGD
ncbi:MAG: PQQ-dependent sugar dehydrogenase [Mesorhizobium sp.]|nr:PQQ-dependent sugar dehydrogenase [Mesorhizobium sp.]